MNDDFFKLYKKFNHIKNKGWIITMRKEDTGIGYTFESLINITENNFSIPDYNSIEIKTMRHYSKRKINLYNATPDGNYLFPIKRILNILGYPDKLNPKYKIFNMSFNAKEFTNIGYYKKSKLFVNDKDKKVSLIAFDNVGNNLNINISWSYDLLKEKLNTKLKNLAVMTASSKIIKGQEYFLYNKINFYTLKNFETFISLIKSGYITVTFKIGVFKTGKRIGQIHDRGTTFSINKKDINKLFDEVII